MEGRKADVEFKLESWLQNGAIIGQVGKWVEVFWGVPEFWEREKHLEKTAIYQTTFFREEKKPWRVYPHNRRFEWKAWREITSPLKVPDGKAPLMWQEPLQKEFKTVFAEIQKEIRAKKIVKAVPVVYGKAARTRPLESALFQALKQSPKNTYIFGSWSAGRGCMGFSPEILFYAEKESKIKTMALAGTRKKETYLENPEDFLNDAKELKEHNIVIDDIVTRLSPLGKIKTSKTASLELNYLAHLYTPIQLTPSTPVSFEQLVAVLHPTPALGIAPRTQMDLLRQWRKPEETLGAPFGVRWKSSQFLCLVGIRQLQWDEEFFYIGNGCGVVAESQLDDEWHELKIKRDSVRKMFKI